MPDRVHPDVHPVVSLRSLRMIRRQAGDNHPRTPHVLPMGRFLSSADLNATIARTTPAVLGLLSDGVPRNRRAIVAALAERYPKDEVERTLMRLTVTGQVTGTGGRYTLAPDQG